MNPTTVIPDQQFQQYGFQVRHETSHTRHIYWRDADEFFDSRSVLFSIYDTPGETAEVSSAFIMNPAMIDMPLEPAFTITLEGWEPVYDVLSGHRLLAETNNMPATRVAEYLAFRYLTRRAGQERAPRDIVRAMMTNRHYWERLDDLHLV